MAEVCRDNIQLCEEMPPEIFNEVVDQIVNWFRLPRFVNVFDAGLWVYKAACPRAKYQLIEILSKPQTKESVLGPLLSFFQRTRRKEVPRISQSKTKLRCFLQMKSSQSPLEFFRKWKTAGNAEIVYLIHLLKLLSHLADGRDPLAESLVQSIAPAKSIALRFMDLHQMMADSMGSRLIFGT